MHGKVYHIKIYILTNVLHTKTLESNHMHQQLFNLMIHDNNNSSFTSHDALFYHLLNLCRRDDILVMMLL